MAFRFGHSAARTGCSAVIQRDWASARQATRRPRAVVEGQIAPDRGVHQAHRNAGQLDLLVLDRAPEALHKALVPPGNFAVDRDRGGL